jgi:hypothetical protein
MHYLEQEGGEVLFPGAVLQHLAENRIWLRHPLRHCISNYCIKFMYHKTCGGVLMLGLGVPVFVMVC